MRRRSPWLLVPLLWVVATLVTTTRRGNLIADGQIIPIPWTDLLVERFVALGWWVLALPAIVPVVRWIETRHWPLAARLLGHVAAGAGFIVLHFLARSQLTPSFTHFRLAPGWNGLASILPESVGVYLVIAIGTVLLLMRRSALERERHAVRLESQLAEARLQLLRAQLHPHFLFNALHAVAALTESRPEDARRMISRLAELLRLALELSEEAEVTLAREIDWLERYVELQEVRYENRLAVELRISPDVIGAMVPPLLLQPLVENAIKYAVEPRPGGGRIEVAAERLNGRLRLTVSDDGPGPGTVPPGPGVGLRNTRDRLEALYGGAARVTLGAGGSAAGTGSASAGAEVVVELPYRAGEGA